MESSRNQLTHRRLRVVGFVVGVALLLGLVDGVFYYAGRQLMGEPVGFFGSLDFVLAWLFLAALVFPALALSKRWPLGHGAGALPWVLHGLAGISFSLVFLVGISGVPAMLQDDIDFLSEFGQFLGFFFVLYVLTYAAIVGISHALQHQQLAAERRQATIALEHQLTEVRLEALRRQLHPHFLFNTLNAITGLALQDRGAEVAEALGHLGELLRRSLDEQLSGEISVRQELEILEPYLAIARTRFGDRITAQVSIAPGAADALVPAMLLQPLVENALEHGITAVQGPGILRVQVQRRGATLRVRVEDNGPGFRNGTGGHGIGLSNTRDRIERLYGAEGAVDLGSSKEGGASVLVTFPFRTSEAVTS